MQSHFTKYIILAIASTTCAQAAAGFAFTNPFRMYGMGIRGSTQILQIDGTTGYFSDSLALTLDNQFGTTSIKMDLESTLQDNIYKSATLINLQTDNLSPREELTGGSTLFFNTFTVDEQTTVRIAYTVENKNDIDSVYVLKLSGPGGTTLIDERIDSDQTGSYTLSLSPGSYLLEDSTIMQGLQPDQFGDWTINTTMSMMIVPTPSTLALLAPATLLITRRRR